MKTPKLVSSVFFTWFCLVKSHELYAGVTQYSGTFKKLSTPGGIQECIDTCNRNRKCGAFTWSPIGGCWVEDNGGLFSIGLVTMVKKKINKCEGCPWDFVNLGLQSGCYYPVSDRNNWENAEAACQELDPRSHLIRVDTSEVNNGSLTLKLHFVLWSYAVYP